MSSFGMLIELELTMGNVHEAFHHLKRWYRAASDTQVNPCHQTMERQTTKRVDLYAWRQLPGDPLPINAVPVKINNAIPSDSELCRVFGELTNGRAAGAFGMHAEHIKAWLRNMQWEEDTKSQGAVGAGDNWRLFIRLVQAAWTHGIIP